MTTLITARERAASSAPLFLGAAAGVVLLLSLGEIYRLLTTAIPDWWQADWRNLVTAAGASDPYAAAEGYRWSPVAAWLLRPIVAVGWLPFIAAHFAVLLLLRDPRLVAVMLLWWPFWNDMLWGNLVTFVFVAAWLALSGSRVATIAFYVMAMLMPRPLMLPILVWLLWKQPNTRVCFAGLLAAHLGLVLVSGLGDEWFVRLVATPAGELLHESNFTLTRFVGWAWVPIGAVLAILFVAKGRIGLASIAIQPYLFPYYMMFGLLELRPKANDLGADRPGSRLTGLIGAWGRMRTSPRTTSGTAAPRVAEAVATRPPSDP